jgi:hypothetical protein
VRRRTFNRELPYNVNTALDTLFMLSRAFPPAVLPVLVVTLLAGFCNAQQGAVDLRGKPVDPVRENSGRVVVLVFVRKDCPISGRYAPTIQRAHAEHEKSVQFYLVFPDKSDSAADIRKYVQDFRYSIPALRDPDHVLVKESHAQITPDAAVFDRNGALIYHGRIDNLYVSFGRARTQPTTHELEDAIEAALAGHAPTKAEAAGVGCFISDLE